MTDPNLLRHFKSALGSMGDTESAPGPKPLCKMVRTLAEALDGVDGSISISKKCPFVDSPDPLLAPAA